VLALPDPYRTRLRTTNSQAAVRLLGALLMEWDEQWSSGTRYVQMDAYWQWKEQQQQQKQAVPEAEVGKEVVAQVA